MMIEEACCKGEFLAVDTAKWFKALIPHSEGEKLCCKLDEINECSKARL